MKFSIALLALVARLTVAEHCDDAGARTNEEMDVCIAALEDATYRDEKRTAFTDVCMPLGPRGFSDGQIVALIDLFTYSDDKSSVLIEMGEKALGINCSQAVPIIDAYSYSDTKKTALSKALLPLLTDVETLASQALIVAAFTYQSDKDWAAALLAKATNRNCVYGRITAKRVIFLVDVSGSMAAQFTEDDGTRYTRLGYVAAQLTAVVYTELTPAQSFNVFHFSGGPPTAWEEGLQPWTAAAVASASTFIATFEPDMPPGPPGTDIFDALQTAYADPDVLAVYLLTDGFPNMGEGPDSIVSACSAWSKNASIPTHTVAFIRGHMEGDNATASKELMLAVAAATGGTYRAMQ